MNINITNICFKGHLKCLINIKHLYNVENKIKMKFQPEKFPGLILFFPFGTCLVFNSGYFSICGCKVISDGYLTQVDLYEILERNGYQINNRNLILTNVCGSFDFGRSINLIKLALSYKKEAYYDVELFPGLKFNLHNHIFTIHHTGKVFVTGMKSIKELYSTCRILIDILTELI